MLKKYSTSAPPFLRLGFLWALSSLLIAFIINYAQPANAQPSLFVLIGENKNALGEQQALPPFILQLFAQLETELGQKLLIERYPWMRAIKLAETEKKLIFGFSYTTERAKTFRFSEPLYYNNIWLITRSDSTFPFKTLQDLKGKSIGILRGASYGGAFDEQKNKMFRVEDDIDAYPTRLKKLLMKRMDAMLYASAESRPQIVEAQVNKILLNDAEINSLDLVRFSVLPIPVLRDGIRFAINKDDSSDIIHRLDIAIEKARKSGAINKIIPAPSTP
jgi:ABC-type amino acid transport substrate-binding protein